MAKQTNSFKEMLDKVLPSYLPTDKAYMLDTRAKRIVKVEVVESITKYSLVENPDESVKKESAIEHWYEVKTSIGNMALPESKMIRTYKDAAIQLGKLLID